MRNLTYDYYCNWETNGKRRSPDSPLRCAKKHSAESATEADSALQKNDRAACTLILIVPPVPTVKRMGSLLTEHAI